MSLKRRLIRLEAAIGADGPCAVVTADDFGDIKRYTDAFRFRQRTGRWPATMTSHEIWQLERDMRIIESGNGETGKSES